MWWCCVLCGQRQDEQRPCPRCDEDPVDLRQPDVRLLLEDIEDRQRDGRDRRRTWIAVAVAMVVVIGLWLVPGWWQLRGRLYPGLPFFMDQWAIMVLVALLTRWALARRPYRARFPFLAELP
jgi:hypothetical protein